MPAIIWWLGAGLVGWFLASAKGCTATGPLGTSIQTRGIFSGPEGGPTVENAGMGNAGMTPVNIALLAGAGYLVYRMTK